MLEENSNKTVDTETIPVGYIVQAKPLVEGINLKNKEIAGIEKLKQLQQPSENLKIIDSELNKADEKKHILVNQLAEIRKPMNEEFAYKYQLILNETTKLEAKIKQKHPDEDAYNQLRKKLTQTQNKHISLIQNNIESEKILADQSEDKDLQDEAKTHLSHLYNDELGLQTKRLEALEEKNQLINLNAHLHDKESNEKQLLESSAAIERCSKRILLLENETKIKGKAPQSKSSEYEINSFYGQEGQLTVADPTTTQKSLSESEQLEQQREVLEVQRQKIIDQLKNKKLSLQDRSILLSELKGTELADKAKYDRIVELEKKKPEVSVDHDVKPQQVKSISKSTKEQGAVPKQEPNADKQTKERSDQISELTQQQKKLKELLAKSKADSLKNPSKTALLDELKARQATQGRSPFPLFGSGNSSTSGDKTKTQEKEIKRKEFSR